MLLETLGEYAFRDDSATAELIQNATVFLATGKGKGKCKGRGKYSVRPSPLSVQDRNNKLEYVKKITECRKCGRTGHWAGDLACSMSKQKAAHVAIKSSNSGSILFSVLDGSSSDEGGLKTAHMSCVVYRISSTSAMRAVRKKRMKVMASYLTAHA
ncbi:hypothetical protein N9L68_05380 [bacterium]|nr:hypothetical protein [bacterium]